MRIALVSLFNLHSYGIRMLHEMIGMEFNHVVKSFYFFKSTYTDTDFCQADVDGFCEELIKYKPDVVFMGVHSPVAPVARDIASYLVSRCPARIVVGGPHAAACPDKCKTWAEEVCVGDGISAVRKYLNGDKSEMWPNIPPRTLDMDDTPKPFYPAMWTGKDHEVHYGFEDEDIFDEKRVSLFSSNGCFYQCSYCHENVIKKHCNKYTVGRKSVSRVINEIGDLMIAFPRLEEVSFSDHIFTFNQDWISEFCRKFTHLYPKFRCFGHFNHVSYTMLKDMKFAGLSFISFGIQHVNPGIAGKFGRHTSRKRILEVARILDDLGIHARYDVIRGIPGETDEQRKEMAEFLDRLPRPHTIRNFEMRYFPGTDLTEQALKDGFICPSQVEGAFTRLGDWSYNYTKY